MRSEKGDRNDREIKREKRKHKSPSPLKESNIPQYNNPLIAYALPTIVFLAALFISITISNPALFLNDEWITVNQLHQLDEGTQLIVNEGKYGVFINGTPGPYFAYRNNLLGYTLMLPALSLPIMKIFGLFGDQFRFLVILTWASIPVAIALIADMIYPRYARWMNIRWMWLIIGASFICLLANIALYYPFPFTPADAPGEVAAVIFTNHILFALLAAATFLICRIVFHDDRYALFGTLAIVSASSYLFWASNAKDHMLSAAVFAVVLLFLVRYVADEKYLDAAIAFVCIGLLAWARPELGFTVFLGVTAYYSFIHLRRYWLYNQDRSNLLKTITAPFWTLAGLIPLFINNLYVTGNPLVPAFYVYERRLTGTADPSGGTIGGEMIHGISQSVPAPSGGIAGFVNTLTNHFSPNWGMIPTDILGILFAPASGNMSLIAVSPLILIVLIILPVLLYKMPSTFSGSDTKFLLLFAITGAAIWAAYLRSLSGLNASSGIMPDIRYLVPFYLPAGLIALFAIRRVIRDDDISRLATWTGASVLIISPVLLILMMLTQPFGGLYKGYTTFFSLLAFITLAALLILFILKIFTQKISSAMVIGIIALLIAIPLGWQLMMVILYSAAKFNGYPFWIPIIEYIYNSFISVDIKTPIDQALQK